MYQPKLISFIGAGGKSTLIQNIASKLRKDKKVLISSTIDIKRIPEDRIDLIDYDFKEDYNLCKTYENGIYVISEGLTNDNKLKGLKLDTITNLSNCFDISLIECDYTTGRNLKAWREDEPTIPSGTDLLIYILDVSMIGKKINVENIHNVDVFCDLTGKKIRSTIETDDIVKLILSKEDSFESLGIRRLLFINKVEDEIKEKYALEIYERIKDLGFAIIAYGSVRDNKIITLKEEICAN